MDIGTINGHIMRGSWTNEELSSMIDAIKFARTSLGRAKMRSFGIGDRVRFTSQRNGRTYQGTVTDCKIKNIIVDTGTGRFKVPANMLEAA
tara:strand:+ start:1990 stop:2262 length:273 start_codon:yes stop_codon:yes gene_type:complete